MSAAPPAHNPHREDTARCHKRKRRRPPPKIRKASKRPHRSRRPLHCPKQSHKSNPDHIGRTVPNRTPPLGSPDKAPCHILHPYKKSPSPPPPRSAAAPLLPDTRLRQTAGPRRSASRFPPPPR